MVLEISKSLSSKLKNKNFRKAIEDSEPNLGNPNQRAILLDVEDVGASYEPRLIITYDIYLNNMYEGKYVQTLVLEKNFELVCIVDNRWIS
jgi:hypothetical protein